MNPDTGPNNRLETGSQAPSRVHSEKFIVTIHQ
jgi:hypothetical protein